MPHPLPSLSGPRFAVLIASVLLSGLAACTSYAPAPVDLVASAKTFEARRVEMPTSRSLTEVEALRIALRNAPSVRQAQAAYASAVAAARTARVRPAWTLTLTAEYSRQSDPQHPWLYGGAVDVPLDVGGRRGARLETADLGVLKARYDVAEAIWTTRTALRRAVADRAIAREEVELAARAVDLREQRAAAFARRVAAGEDGRPTALTASTEHALSVQRLTAARAAAAQADAGLAAAMGVPVEAVAGLEVVPTTSASPDVDAIRSARFDAATARGDVLRTVIDYDLAEQALRQAVAGQYPQITLSPGYTWERGITKLPFNLGLALPPPDLNRAAINEAEVRRVEAGKALETAQAAVYAQTDAATAALAAADAGLERARMRDIQLARRAEAVTARAVQLGELDRTDLLSAQAAVLDARLGEIDAARQRAAALADLEAATRALPDPSELTVIADEMARLDQAQ